MWLPADSPCTWVGVAAVSATVVRRRSVQVCIVERCSGRHEQSGTMNSNLPRQSVCAVQGRTLLVARTCSAGSPLRKHQCVLPRASASASASACEGDGNASRSFDAWQLSEQGPAINDSWWQRLLLVVRRVVTAVIVMATGLLAASAATARCVATGCMSPRSLGALHRARRRHPGCRSTASSCRAAAHAWLCGRNQQYSL